MYLRIVILSFVLGLTQATAIEVSHTEYMDIQQQNLQQIDLQRLPETSSDSAILSSSAPQQAIANIYFALQQLSDIKQPHEKLRNWVEYYTNSRLQLTSRQKEHPEQSIVLVDIARAAKNTQLQWQIFALQEEIADLWQSGSFDWYSLMDSTSDLKVRALDRWLSELDAATIDNVAAHFLQQVDISQLSNNQVLARLIQSSHSTELLEKLWSRPADQYSYMILQQLPHWDVPYVAINQTIKATSNKALQSQAFLSLAKNYSQDEYAQKTILEALNNKDSQWHAVMTLSLISDVSFKAKLKAAFKQRESKVARVAMQQLSKEQ